MIGLCEKVYPESPPWTVEQLASHLRVFPEGQFVIEDHLTGKIVGMSSSLIVRWDDYAFGANWREMTDKGLFTNHDPVGGRTLYGAEVMVDPEMQRKGLGKKLYVARRELVRRLGLRRIRAGARLRGYHRFASRMSVEEYVQSVVRGEHRDPTLTFQLREGFEVVAVVHSYLMHDPESLGYAAVIEWLNPDVALPEDSAGRDPRFERPTSSVSALRVRYRLRIAAGEDPTVRAAQLAREQSIEIAAGGAPEEVEARAIGRVERFETDGAGAAAVEIAYPLETIGGELLQLLNVLWGNVSLQTGVRVESVLWPAALLERLPGPAFGVAGLRELCGGFGRPLAATALKPLGLSAGELARRAATCALAGIDLIKDDHGIGDQDWSPFRERVLRVSEWVARANRRSGGSTLYVPNLTGPVDRLGERLETLARSRSACRPGGAGAARLRRGAEPRGELGSGAGRPPCVRRLARWP